MFSPKNFRGAMGLHTYPLQPAGPSDRWLSPRVPRMNLLPTGHHIHGERRGHAGATRNQGRSEPKTKNTNSEDAPPSHITGPTRASFLRCACRHHGVSRIFHHSPKIILWNGKKCLHCPSRFAIIYSVESERRVSNFNRWRSLPSLPSLATGDYSHAR